MEPFKDVSASMLSIEDLKKLIQFNTRSRQNACIPSKVKAMDAVLYQIRQARDVIGPTPGCALSVEGSTLKFTTEACELKAHFSMVGGVDSHESLDCLFQLMLGEPARITNGFEDTNSEETWYDLRIEEDGTYVFGAEGWSCRVRKEHVGFREVAMMRFLCLQLLEGSDVMFSRQVDDARMVARCKDLDPRELTSTIEDQTNGGKMIREFAKAGLSAEAFLKAVQHAFDRQSDFETLPFHDLYSALWIQDDKKGGPAPGRLPEGVPGEFVSSVFHGIVTRIRPRDEDCLDPSEPEIRQKMIWLLENIDVLRVRA